MMLSEARDPQTYAIIGAAMEVHRELGCGFLEAAYQEAFALELTSRNIPFRREVCLEIFYKRQRLACTYKADFICYDNVIVEIKALKELSAIDRAQTINYLKITRSARALLLNFGATVLEYERLVNSSSSA